MAVPAVPAAKPSQPLRPVPAAVLGSSTWAPISSRPQLAEKRRVQIPRAWSQPVPPARCIPVIPAKQQVPPEGDRAQSISPRRLTSRTEDWRRCMRQLNIIREALKMWPSASTELALKEALDFAWRSSGLQPSDSWTAQELRCFGLRMLATHGLEAVDWPAGQWLSMLHTVDHEPGKSNSDKTTVEPLQSEDAAKLGKLAFQTLQTQLETEVKRFGTSESTTAVVSPSSISSSGTWQTMGAAGPYVQIIGNASQPQSARRLKASPRNRERPMVRAASGHLAPVPMVPEPVLPLAAPAVVQGPGRPSSSLSIEVELAQLRQEIATERCERQALAQLVDSLVKERQQERGQEQERGQGRGPIAVPKRRCDEKDSKGQEWLPGFRPLEDTDHHCNDVIAEEDGERTLDISFFQHEPGEVPEATTPEAPKAPACSFRKAPLPAALPVKDSLLADASAALDALAEILGPSERPEAERAAVPQGSPGFNLEREESQDLQFYRRRCLELAEEVQKREAELVHLRQALQEASNLAPSCQ